MILISSQLILGAAAAFLAILLWPKIRDAAWMMIIFGVLVVYIETVYSILKDFGIAGDELIISIILPAIRTLFFIIAFIIMIYKQTRHT